MSTFVHPELNSCLFGGKGGGVFVNTELYSLIVSGRSPSLGSLRQSETGGNMDAETMYYILHDNTDCRSKK